MDGVLLLQLGTPDEPTPRALRRYLREFLSDPRVIEVPRWKWWLILNLFVLPFRPADSAAKYRRIWDPELGSPLLHMTRRQAALLSESLQGRPVAFGMRYGNPGISEALAQLEAAGVTRIQVLPLYPQYSATTTASALDGLFAALRRRRVVPALQTICEFHRNPAYVEALAARIESFSYPEDRPPQRVLISFHGIPRAYEERGDPYRRQCEATARLLVERMGWADDHWQLVFQSRFGREPWLEPYFDETLEALPGQGITRVMVVQPGFTTDCLETIDEIGREGAEEFAAAGGEALYRVPCLNDHPAFIEALASILLAPEAARSDTTWSTS